MTRLRPAPQKSIPRSRKRGIRRRIEPPVSPGGFFSWSHGSAGRRRGDAARRRAAYGRLLSVAGARPRRGDRRRNQWRQPLWRPLSQ
ncbi:hypothetical protein X949_5611 [Burkholderia pseudomallei MSHR5609]|nr:hypothetical protein X949_5611 [Burkholderia pseudomallei MSHR5609]